MSAKEVKVSKLRDLDKILTDAEEYAEKVPIKTLTNVLEKMSVQYYGTGEPYVDDETYDLMIDILRKRDPENEFLFKVGAPIQADEAVKLPFAMPSLAKIKFGEKSLGKWFNKYNGPYVVSDKLDGISAQLFKNETGASKLFTRGNATEGRDITHLLKYLISDSILKKLPNNTSVRGEILISRKDFTNHFETEYKNPRNMMAGFVNDKKVNTKIAEKAQLVMYGIIHPRYSISKQFEILEKYGFKVAWHEELIYDDGNDDDEEKDDGNEEDEKDDGEEDEKNDEQNIRRLANIEKKLVAILTERKKKSEFDIDGLVIMDDYKTYLHSDTFPPYAMAFKMNVDTKDVKVTSVTWEPTMYGYLKPVIQVEPTKLSGVTITNATAHNAKFIFDNNIGKGSIIKIVRSGEVIPYVVSIVKESKKPDMPNIEYEWNDTKVDIVVVNPSKETQRLITIYRILHFFREIKVKYLSKGIITKLYDAGYQSILDIVKASRDLDTNTYNISGLGKAMMTKIYDQIDKALERVTLEQLMSGTIIFGRGMGTRKLKQIILKYPDILDHDPDDSDELKEMIMEVEGFSDISADKFVENFNEFLEFLENLKKVTDHNLEFKPKANPKSKSKSKAKGKSATVDMSKEIVVMTGFRDDDIKNFIESNGGKVTEGVSKKTTLLLHVPTDKVSSKYQKADDLGIKILTKDEFIKAYKL